MTKLALVILLCTGCAMQSPLYHLSEQMQGRFVSSEVVTSSDGRSLPSFVDHRVRIHAPPLGEWVFYQQLNQGEKVYRQRILVLSDQDGVISQRAYSLKQPEAFVDACAEHQVFRGLSWEALVPVLQADCEMLWRENVAGYEGYVDPSVCRITSKRTGKPRRIEARAVLKDNRLGLEERGFDDDMKQLFGSGVNETLWLERQASRCL